eukprot:2714843-Prymnesium_polylepis.3
MFGRDVRIRFITLSTTGSVCCSLACVFLPGPYPDGRKPPRTRRGLWPMVRREAVLGRYAVLRCLWHEVRDHERSNM